MADVHAVAGNDEAAIEEFLEITCPRGVSNEKFEINTSANLAPLLGALRSVSLLAHSRNVICTAETLDDKQVAEIVEALKQTTATVVFVTKKGSKIWNQIKKFGEVHDLKQPTANNFPKEVQAIFAAHGVKLAPAQAKLVAQKSGFQTIRVKRYAQLLQASGSVAVTDKLIDATFPTEESLTLPWEAVSDLARGTFPTECDPYAFCGFLHGFLYEMYVSVAHGATSKTDVAKILNQPAWKCDRHQLWLHLKLEDIRTLRTALLDCELALRTTGKNPVDELRLLLLSVMSLAV